MLREERFFESEQEIFSILRDAGFAPKLIVDIGASDGAWTRGCLGLFPDAHYHLYEPLYSHLEHYQIGLDKLIANNNKVSVHALALADVAQVADFFITPHSVGSSLLPVGDARKIQVEITTLDQDLKHITTPIDILKMDTQGGELRILKGAQSVIPRSRVIVVESWFYRGYGSPTPLAHEIVDELLQYDFRVFGMGGPYFDPGNVTVRCGSVFWQKRCLGTPRIPSILKSGKLDCVGCRRGRCVDHRSIANSRPAPSIQLPSRVICQLSQPTYARSHESSARCSIEIRLYSVMSTSLKRVGRR